MCACTVQDSGFTVTFSGMQTAYTSLPTLLSLLLWSSPLQITFLLLLCLKFQKKKSILHICGKTCTICRSKAGLFYLTWWFSGSINFSANSMILFFTPEQQHPTVLWFYAMATVNGAAINMGVRCCTLAWIFVSIQRHIAGPYGSPSFLSVYPGAHSWAIW